MISFNFQVATWVFFLLAPATSVTNAFPGQAGGGRSSSVHHDPSRIENSHNNNNNKVVFKCPFQRERRRRTQQEKNANDDEMKLEAEARMEEWLALEATLDESPDSLEPLVGRLYVPGEQNPGEEYCDGSSDHKFCNKLHGAWGDSIPQNGTYCLWTILEFQDPTAFNYGQENDNTTAFNGIFESTVGTVAPLLGEKKVLMAGATGGQSGGDPQALPWPTAAIIWSDGNKYAKDWILNEHRPSQEAGYDFGFILHGHYKAVQCADINPVLEKHGLLNESMASVYWQGEGIIAGTYGFRRMWNAFSDVKDYSPDFYQPEEICVVGPCPDGVTEDDADSTPAQDSANGTSSGGGASGASGGASEAGGASSAAMNTAGMQHVSFALMSVAILMSLTLQT